MDSDCKICAAGFSSQRKLSKHIRDQHLMCSHEYYDTHLKSPQEGVCEFCGKATKFLSISAGYRKSCKDCKSQKASQFRSLNKLDEAKHKQFVEKVKENQVRIWKERKSSGLANSIRSKIGSTIKRNNQNLTSAERRDRYGWLHRLSPENQEKWKQEVMLQTGYHKWWKSATSEDIKQIVIKRFATLTRICKELVEAAHRDPQDMDKYYQAVWSITDVNYYKNRTVIDPDSKRGPDWHLDHIYSVKAGFINKVDPFIIGSCANLRIISKSENLQKNARCDITLEQLLEKYNDKI